MFASTQILSASKLIKDFKSISNALDQNPQAILITQKSKSHLVLVNAYLYENLLENSIKNKNFDADF